MYSKNGVIYSEGIGVCRIILSAMSKKRQQDLHMVLYFYKT